MTLLYCTNLAKKKVLPTDLFLSEQKMVSNCEDCEEIDSVLSKGKSPFNYSLTVIK